MWLVKILPKMTLNDRALGKQVEWDEQMVKVFDFLDNRAMPMKQEDPRRDELANVVHACEQDLPGYSKLMFAQRQDNGRRKTFVAYRHHTVSRRRIGAPGMHQLPRAHDPVRIRRKGGGLLNLFKPRSFEEAKRLEHFEQSFDAQCHASSSGPATRVNSLLMGDRCSPGPQDVLRLRRAEHPRIAYTSLPADLL